MKAIIDILKEHNLYTFMAIKEALITTIESALSATEYAGKYGLSGSFTSTDQTISIVVGVLADQLLRPFISSGAGAYAGAGTTEFREYTYGINITGINDDEVKSLAKYLFYYVINKIPDINYDVRARIHPNLYMQPLTSTNIGEKRMWSINIYATADINEQYLPRPVEGPYSSGELRADGYVPPDYSSCVIIDEQ